MVLLTSVLSSKFNCNFFKSKHLFFKSYNPSTLRSYPLPIRNQVQALQHRLSPQCSQRSHRIPKVFLDEEMPEFPPVAQQKQTRLASVTTRVPSLASLSGLGIQHCHELWCRPHPYTPSSLGNFHVLWVRP